MAISKNTKVLFNTKANLLSGMIGNKRGDILVGDRAFEFYNEKNPEDYLQIPWEEIIRVRAQLFFRDKYIRGFFVDTKSAGTFNFIVKNAGKTLKTMRDFLGNEKIVRNKPLLSMKNIFNLFKKNK